MMLNFLPKEDWIAQRRQARKNTVSTSIANYAKPEEIARLKAALRERFKHITGDSPEDIRYRRGCLRQAIRAIENGRIPAAHTIEGAEDLLASVRAKYEAARNTVTVADEDEELAAWNHEIARREELNRRYGDAA